MNAVSYLALLACILTLAGCGNSRSVTKDGPPTGNIEVAAIPNAKPKWEPRSHYGNPSSYQIKGRTYHVLASAKNYNKHGIASWYGTKFNGQLTSSREPYNMLAMTAASTELPIPSYARVTNLKNGRSIVVRVNDRGPFVDNRLIDLSYVAAKKLDYIKQGTAPVEVSAIDVGQSAPQAAYLQIGTFRNYANAVKTKQHLMRLTSQSVRIDAIRRDSNNIIYRVKVGPIYGSSSAARLRAQLNTMGYSGVIII